MSCVAVHPCAFCKTTVGNTSIFSEFKRQSRMLNFDFHNDRSTVWWICRQRKDKRINKLKIKTDPKLFCVNLEKWEISYLFIRASILALYCMFSSRSVVLSFIFFNSIPICIPHRGRINPMGFELIGSFVQDLTGFIWWRAHSWIVFRILRDYISNNICNHWL